MYPIPVCHVSCDVWWVQSTHTCTVAMLLTILRSNSVPRSPCERERAHPCSNAVSLCATIWLQRRTNYERDGALCDIRMDSAFSRWRARRRWGDKMFLFSHCRFMWTQHNSQLPRGSQNGRTYAHASRLNEYFYERKMHSGVFCGTWTIIHPSKRSRLAKNAVTVNRNRTVGIWRKFAFHTKSYSLLRSLLFSMLFLLFRGWICFVLFCWMCAKFCRRVLSGIVPPWVLFSNENSIVKRFASFQVIDRI